MTVIPPLIFHINHQQPKWFWSRRLRKQSGSGKALLLNSGEMKGNYTGCTAGVFFNCLLSVWVVQLECCLLSPWQAERYLSCRKCRVPAVSACMEVAQRVLGPARSVGHTAFVSGPRVAIWPIPYICDTALGLLAGRQGSPQLSYEDNTPVIFYRGQLKCCSHFRVEACGIP